MALSHRVRALRWQVQAGSQEEAFALRKRLRDDLHPVLLPAIDQAFDAAAPDGVLRIPRLEIHLKIAAGDRFAELLAELIRLRLLELLRSAVSTSETFELPLAFTRVTTEEENLQLLTRYLETGDLPWSAASSDRTAILDELRLAAARELEVILASPVSGNRVAFYFRLLQLVPEEEWVQVARAVASVDARHLGEALSEAVIALAGARSVSRYSRLQLAAAALTAIGTIPDSNSAEEVTSILADVLSKRREAVENLIVSLPEAVSAFFRLWLEGSTRHRELPPRSEAPVSEAVESRRGTGAVPGGQAHDEITPPSLRRPGRAVGGAAERIGAGKGLKDIKDLNDVKDIKDFKETRDTKEATKLEPFSSLESWRISLSYGDERREAQALETLTRVASQQASPQPAEEWLARAAVGTAGTSPSGLHVTPDQDPVPGEQPLVARLAGLILLHPFLPRFFESTGVLKEGQVELPRAAALLHLLATGEEEVYELELGFIKILLGLRPGSPLPVSEGLLCESDRDEAEALLQAVIGHWSVLKNTSLEGLRQTFLQRRGLLREKKEGFELQLEPEAFDVLLGHLPWGIGTVKLPWMKKAIFTDWPAH
ncbi:MAG TPA: contractile injection system tape measure protein [Thermoanaerobaculia bacterium]|nr:contractile injection system tape measure protein [Thermoanaerobaculia bacterium]